jgi:hypothetical protein
MPDGGVNHSLRAFGDDYVGMLINSFTGTNLTLAAAVTYDAITRGRPHRVYAIGIPLIFLVSYLHHGSTTQLSGRHSREP